jgi:predicted esterase
MLGAAAPLTPGLHTSVTFDRVSPVSSTAELLRRVYTPLTAKHIATTGSITGQPLDITRETFAVYMPEHKPPQSYALLVFVPPWNGTNLPAGWASVLDDEGVIFVSAANSGNDAAVQFRRIPLAVMAAEQLMQDYSIDPSRVLVGGFSGGARVALRLALAYPDVFRGALLNSGSDPIGTAAIPLPPPDLLHRFQEGSRVYYLTGDLDMGPRGEQAESKASLQKFCVFDVQTAAFWRAGHTTADKHALSAALDALLDPAPAKHDGLAECRAHLQSELAANVQRVEALSASSDKASARQALDDLDTKFGNLAAAQILALEKRLSDSQSH